MIAGGKRPIASTFAQGFLHGSRSLPKAQPLIRLPRVERTDRESLRTIHLASGYHYLSVVPPATTPLVISNPASRLQAQAIATGERSLRTR